jgi:hypothetical protein
MTPLEGREALEERLGLLSEWLEEHRALWTHRPFVEMPAPWEQEMPGLARWLRALPEATVDAMENDPSFLPPDAPAEITRLREEAAPLVDLPVAAGSRPPGLEDPRLKVFVKGRKWSQVVAFSSAVLAALPEGVVRLVDFCAGYGHLGRSLAAVTGLETVLVERDPLLCEEGRRLADRLGVPYRYVEAEARSPQAAEPLGEGTAAMGLHACGELADALIEQGILRGVTFLGAAFCCYHQVEDRPLYRPRSVAARALDLRLEPHLLRLPLYDEVVSHPRVQRARRREMAFRAGLDLLAREASGEDRYHSLGNLSVAELRGSFADFCATMSRRTGWVLPGRFDPGAAERAGWERARQARALGSVRGAFRRPLELWLVLDRALWLVEGGRGARVQTFCPREVTPRNLLVTSRLVGQGLSPTQVPRAGPLLPLRAAAKAPTRATAPAAKSATRRALKSVGVQPRPELPPIAA